MVLRSLSARRLIQRLWASRVFGHQHPADEKASRWISLTACLATLSTGWKSQRHKLPSVSLRKAAAVYLRHFSAQTKSGMSTRNTDDRVFSPRRLKLYVK